MSNRSAPFRVGLSWAGNPLNTNDPTRSATWAAFSHLLMVPPRLVQFVSLQKSGDQPDGLERPPLADSADVVAGLDLVITVDPAVCHLATAIGVPTWILLSHDSPSKDAYATARLFRQQPGEAWSDVIIKVAQALVQRVYGVKAITLG